MIITGKNFIGQIDPPKADEYRKCNFSQLVPVNNAGLRRGVRLWPADDTPRIFVDCNMVNAEPPPGSTITRGNNWITEYNVLTPADTVTVDGQPLIVEHHSNFTYAKLNPDLTYTDLPSPRENVID